MLNQIERAASGPGKFPGKPSEPPLPGEPETEPVLPDNWRHPPSPAIQPNEPWEPVKSPPREIEIG